MAIQVELVTPDNASNPTSVEAAIQQNNEAIKAALLKAVSREPEDGLNYFWTDLDLNGKALLNVGASPFLKKEDLEAVKAGEIRKNSATGDLEYRKPEEILWTVLYTAEELKGLAGTDGAGTGDMQKSENLSGLANTATARTNLGLALGVDVLAYSADLDGFDPADKVDSDDLRFSRFPVTTFTANTTVSDWGKLYRYEGGSSGVTLSIGASTDGSVISVYVAPGSPGITLAPTGGASLRLAGSTTVSATISVVAGGYVSVICSNTPGTNFIVAGSGAS